MESAPVLVVGGSLVGVSTAMFLEWKYIKTIVVERHASTSKHPRAIGYTPRTLELFRAVGLGPRVPPAPANFRLLRARIQSLAGDWYEQTEWTPENTKDEKREYSPCLGAAIAQDRLEPILRDKASEFGADIRFSTELVGFEQDANGVTACLREQNGREYTVRAQYMVAADGAQGPVRKALGIGKQGRGHMRTVRSVLFQAPLDEYLAKGVMQFEVEQPDLRAFLTTYNDGRWVLMFKDDIERDEAALREAIFKVIGRTDVPVEIITTGRWDLSATVSDSFASGRIFLAGDSAHTLPPTRGGYGANTGISDAHNLAWKLAAVLSGEARPELLETYAAERRPVALLRHQQIFARPDYKRDAAGIAEGEPIIDDDAMEFGQLYRSGAVIGAGENLPAALRPDQWKGQPGTRAPHLWLTKDGERISTLDLFQHSWVLLTEDPRWIQNGEEAAKQLGLKLSCVVMGQDFQPEEPGVFSTAFGLRSSGTSLVRPDGFIAWRSLEFPVDVLQLLLDVLGEVSFATKQNVAG